VLSLVLREVTPIPEAQEDFPGGYVDLERWYALRDINTAAPSPAQAGAQ
jgi:hypothetical protein